MNPIDTDDDSTTVNSYHQSVTEEEPTGFSDTLVFKIIERDVDNREIDNAIYFIYDAVNEIYLIRGTRYNLNNPEFTYSFCCDELNRLMDFLDFTIDPSNTFTYIMYNFKNLPEDSDNITVDFLKNNSGFHNEIAGYEGRTYVRKQLSGYLKLLKDVYNTI